MTGSASEPHVLKKWMLSKSPQLDISQHDINDAVLYSTSRQIFLTQAVTRTRFAVTVALFHPDPSDPTGYPYTDSSGDKQEYTLPPYYITDMTEAGRSMRRWFSEASADYPTALLHNVNPLVREVFDEAQRYYRDTQASALVHCVWRDAD